MGFGAASMLDKLVFPDTKSPIKWTRGIGYWFVRLDGVFLQVIMLVSEEIR